MPRVGSSVYGTSPFFSKAAQHNDDRSLGEPTTPAWEVSGANFAWDAVPQETQAPLRLAPRKELGVRDDTSVPPLGLLYCSW